MRRITWVFVIVLCVAVVLAGCGKKDVGGVVKDLEQVVSNLESYQAQGSMLLHTGQQPLEYEVEVWYQSPHYYRIALTNVKKDITQIVLRNDDGVFVLTPHLKKSFRFQSDWPDHQGQVYLYQTLVQSILKDEQRQFTTDDENGAYVFDVAANYENSSLVRQKVWLSQKNYAPQQVEIVDESSNVMVLVEFKHFEFDKKFEADSFEMQRNMTSWNLQSLPVIANMEDDEWQEEAGAAKDEWQEEASAEEEQASQEEPQDYFGVFMPSYTPEGVEQVDVQDAMIGDGQAVLMRYAGEYNYTIMEARPTSLSATVLPGTIVDLHHTIGVLTGTADNKKMLRWIHDGVEFRLSTGDLPHHEMLQIAQSVEGQIGK